MFGTSIWYVVHLRPVIGRWRFGAATSRLDITWQLDLVICWMQKKKGKKEKKRKIYVV
jgi:hypothetical protein